MFNEWYIVDGTALVEDIDNNKNSCSYVVEVFNIA